MTDPFELVDRREVMEDVEVLCARAYSIRCKAIAVLKAQPARPLKETQKARQELVMADYFIGSGPMKESWWRTASS